MTEHIVCGNAVDIFIAHKSLYCFPQFFSFIQCHSTWLFILLTSPQVGLLCVHYSSDLVNTFSIRT